MKTSMHLKSIMLIVVLTASALISRAQTYIDDPIEYNDFIIGQQMKISDELKIFSNILSDVSKSKEDAKGQLVNLKNAAENAIDNVSNLNKMDPDFDLRDNAVSLFKFYLKTIENAYVELVDEYFSEYPSEENVKEIFRKITAEEEEYDKAFLSAQEDFAEYYNFTLE